MSCSLSSNRAKKARLAKELQNRPLRYTLIAVLFLSAILWIWLAIIRIHPIAHVPAVIIAITAVLLGWYYGELSKLKPEEQTDDPQDVSGYLDQEILGRLSSGYSTEDLTKIVFSLPGGMFYANRFFVPPDFVAQSLVSGEVSEQRIWARAKQLAEDNNQQELADVIVAAALILEMPKSESFLAHLQLERQDIQAGIIWHGRIKSAIEHHMDKKNTGGIGRDLSFGWAPILNHVGYNVSYYVQMSGVAQRTPASRNQTVGLIMQLLAQPGKRNVALIGDVGVGKTTVVRALAEKFLENPNDVPEALRYRQVVELDAAHLISVASAPGQIEQLMISIFNEAVRVKNIILFFDNAELFFRGGTGSIDIASIILPVLQGGALQVVFSMTDQQWQIINHTYPELAQLLNRVVMQPLDANETMQVMQDESLFLEAKHRLVYTYHALKEAYRLAERYVNDQAFPGRAIKLLESATVFAEHQHFITRKSVAEAVEKTYGVKVQQADTAQEKDVLLNLEDQIHERMVNQSRAVKLVSDALRRARTGVGNTNRPIGTFLFLGPTGVGKTELSKALAEVYFRGEDQLVRIDMNEYSQANDSTRLLAPAATEQFSLTAQISKQPFSVVLLDEIEKAHPNVLNTLLQLLDEGVLRDTANKEVSFKDAIIIATSNAGADKIRTQIAEGKQLEDFEKQFIDELIDDRSFKPEFLNRFDEIILFRPLTQEELLQVVELLLSELNERLTTQKLRVELDQGAKQLLVENGYDPRLGARPLRRTLQRAVENLVAHRVLEGQIRPGEVIYCTASDLNTYIEARK